ncbi:uncharacterized protein [Ambystoma mexicanum]|uniref:uncharacterized protein n=1 Tax=Ambystoma mexicanum TaxID=8296 RepID=UPI0037E76D22
MLIGYFILFSKVLGVRMHPHQKQQLLSFSINDTAAISCLVPEGSPGGGHIVHWFWRRVEAPATFIKFCSDSHAGHLKYNCRHEARSATLEVYKVQRKEAGVYYCAYPKTGALHFSSAATILVGDSYTLRTSVLLVTLPPQVDASGSLVPLACVVRAVSGQVWMSWNISGTSQQGLMSAIRGRDGTLTFISHIAVAMDTWTRGEITCESQFNSSSNGVKKSLVYKAVQTGDATRCLAPVVAGVLLLLLTLSLTLCRVCWSSDKGEQRDLSVVPARDTQGGIVYAQLDFDTKKVQRKKHWREIGGRKI